MLFDLKPHRVRSVFNGAPAAIAPTDWRASRHNLTHFDNLNLTNGCLFNMRRAECASSLLPDCTLCQSFSAIASAPLESRLVVAFHKLLRSRQTICHQLNFVEDPQAVVVH